jgi:hypothetical protein
VEEAEEAVQRAIEEEERAKGSTAKTKAKIALNLAREVLKQAEATLQAFENVQPSPAS